jgi:cytochrome c-type biogenesis protein
VSLDISFLSAFGAGFLSFVSPCVLPLVPPYLCYMAGINFDQFVSDKNNNNSHRRSLITASLFFILGFSTIFILLGIGASFVGQFLRAWQDVFAKISGIIIIIIGLNFLGVLKISSLSKDLRFNPNFVVNNPIAAYIMGLAFAFGWTPCIGPILGPILTLAGSTQNIQYGALLLATYSAGLALPFIFAALFSYQFMKIVKKIKPNMKTIERIIGILIIFSGVMFLTGGIQRISYWLLETFPLLQALG